MAAAAAAAVAYRTIVAALVGAVQICRCRCSSTREAATAAVIQCAGSNEVQ